MKVLQFCYCIWKLHCTLERSSLFSFSSCKIRRQTQKMLYNIGITARRVQRSFYLYSSRGSIASSKDGIHEQDVPLCYVFWQLLINELLFHTLVYGTSFALAQAWLAGWWVHRLVSAQCVRSLKPFKAVLEMRVGKCILYPKERQNKGKKWDTLAC